MYISGQVIRRRSNYELTKLKNRDHVVQGLILALDRIDDVVELVRRSKDTAAARTVLVSDVYGLSEEQANAILALTLGR